MGFASCSHAARPSLAGAGVQTGPRCRPARRLTSSRDSGCCARRRASAALSSACRASCLPTAASAASASAWWAARAASARPQAARAWAASGRNGARAAQKEQEGTQQHCSVAPALPACFSTKQQPAASAAPHPARAAPGRRRRGRAAGRGRRRRRAPPAGWRPTAAAGPVRPPPAGPAPAVSSGATQGAANAKERRRRRQCRGRDIRQRASRAVAGHHCAPPLIPTCSWPCESARTTCSGTASASASTAAISRASTATANKPAALGESPKSSQQHWPALKAQPEPAEWPGVLLMARLQTDGAEQSRARAACVLRGRQPTAGDSSPPLAAARCPGRWGVHARKQSGSQQQAGFRRARPILGPV